MTAGEVAADPIIINPLFRDFVVSCQLSAVVYRYAVTSNRLRPKSKATALGGEVAYARGTRKPKGGRDALRTWYVPGMRYSSSAFRFPRIWAVVARTGYMSGQKWV